MDKLDANICTLSESPPNFEGMIVLVTYVDINDPHVRCRIFLGNGERSHFSLFNSASNSYNRFNNEHSYNNKWRSDR